MNSRFINLLCPESRGSQFEKGRIKVKAIKMFGLAALAALLAMAFVGASSAMAENTFLCGAPAEECERITHVHESTLAGAKGVLLSEPEVKCDVLFLGDPLASEGSPLVIHGNFTYSNCEGGCTATEENGPTEIRVLKTGTELASVTSGAGAGAGLVHLVCFGFINCRYVGTELVGHGLGPQTSSETNGSVSLSGQEVNKESGSLCPETGKLDITTTPLVETYLGQTAPSMYCVKYERVVGFYLGVNGSKKTECINKDGTRVGEYGLIWARAGLTAGTMVCVNLSSKVGLYEKRSSSAPSEKCETDNKANTSLYELATIQ